MLFNAKKYRKIIDGMQNAKIETPLYQTYFENSLRFELEGKSPENFCHIFEFLDGLYDDLFGATNRSEVLIIRRYSKGFVPVPFDFLINDAFRGETMLPIITFNDKDVASTVYLLRNFSYNNDRLFRFCFFGLADSEIIFCDTKFKRVLNIYDNRGCDVVIDDKKFLKEVYLKYSDWILQYNREEIKAKLDIKE